MRIVEIDTNNRRQVNQFLALPFRLYRDIPQWVPALSSDARLVLDRRRYAFYEHSEAAFFLAMEGDRVLGRIAAIDNHNHNTFHKQRTAFFYLFECEDDARASRELFEAACDWAKRRKLETIMGPKGFTALDGLGLLVKGYEYRPALNIPYNLPYYEARVLEAGFEPLDDELSGYLCARAPFPMRIHQVAEKVKERRGLRIVHFRKRRDMLPYLHRLHELYNSSLGTRPDQVPLTAAEVRTMADQLLPIADPRLIKIVVKDDEPVGFLIAYPNVSAAIQRCKGRLLPFGWLDLLLESRRTRWVDVNGMGIIEKYQGLGGMTVLFSEMHKSITQGRYEHAECVQISTHNSKMQLALRDLGFDFYKVHRVYQRSL